MRLLSCLATVIVTLQGIGGAAYSAPATLSLNPAAKTVAIGETFSVDIMLDTGENETEGVDIRFLRYNPLALKAQDSDPVKEGIQIQLGTLYSHAPDIAVDPDNGTIRFSQITSAQTSFNGSGVLATVVFKAIRVGTSSVTFDFTQGLTNDTNIASSGSDVLADAVGAQVVVTGTKVFVDTDPSAVGIQSELDVDTEESFTVDIIANEIGAAAALNVFEFDLNFNPAVLTATSVVSGGFLPSPNAVIESNIVPPDVNFAEGVFGPFGAVGNGVLAKITFKATGVGTSTLDLNDVVLAALGGIDITEVVTDALIRVASRHVDIDIMPGRFPNWIDLKSEGNILVAILTTETFDATTVDLSTVRFGESGTEAAPGRFLLQDADGDKDTDITLHFLRKGTGIVCGDTVAYLTGKTRNGFAIEGSDSITTVGCKLLNSFPVVLGNNFVSTGNPITYAMDFGRSISSDSEVKFVFVFGNDPLDSGECVFMTPGGGGFCNLDSGSQTSRIISFSCVSNPSVCEAFQDGHDSGQLVAETWSGSGNASIFIDSLTVKIKSNRPGIFEGGKD